MATREKSWEGDLLMGWHYNPQTGIWDKYAESPQAAQAEITRINAALARGESIGGASPEYGQTLFTLLALPIAAHAATTALLGATAARAATGAAVGATAGAGGIRAAGAGLGLIAGASLLTTGLKVGAGVYALDWLEKNWWIPALFLGGYIAIKAMK